MHLVRESVSWLVIIDGAPSFSLEQLALRCRFGFADLCSSLGCTSRNLHRIFLRDLGLPPKDWLRSQRMVAARQLLEQGEWPAKVSSSLGFATPSNFGREFKKTYGVTPGEYFHRFFRPPD